MTLQVASPTLSTLRGAENRQSLVVGLKDLKNAVIGNTLKKVEVAEDEGLLGFLLDQFEVDAVDEGECTLVGEVAVIVGALASEGSLTIRPLLLARTSARLLDQVRCLAQSSLPQAPRVLSNVLRALRNVLVATADLVWGHTYGVQLERKVVGTGLVGMIVDNGKGKAVGEEMTLEAEANKALNSIFHLDNLDTMLPLLESRLHQQSTFSLYQIYARLVVLPSHRQALTRWAPVDMRSTTTSPDPSSTAVPYILEHLVKAISSTSSNAKTLEVTLELLAALVKGQRGLVEMIRKMHIPVSRSFRRGYSPDTIDGPRRGAMPTDDFSALLEHLAQTSPNTVRIAVVACMTNFLKVNHRPHQGQAHHQPYITTGVSVLGSVADMWRDQEVDVWGVQELEHIIKLCHVVAPLVAGDVDFQVFALESCDLPRHVMHLLHRIEDEEKIGVINPDIAARAREASLLALAALTSNLEQSRILVTETDPPTLPLLVSALSHPSYGVRAAACQLARSLSRTVSLVRTSLLDSGVPEALVKTLEHECRRRRDPDWAETDDGSSNGSSNEDLLGDQTWSVEITAMMAIANFVVDFSPFKETFLNSTALAQVAHLARSSYDVVAVEALWLIKNAMFNSTEQLKRRILDTLDVDWLNSYIHSSSPVRVRIQGLHVLQNYLSDGTLAGLSLAVESLGEERLFDAIESALEQNYEAELRAAALGVMVNLCYGNEQLRQSIVARQNIVKALVDALQSPVDTIKHQALKAIRNLVTSTTRSERPRLSILEALKDYPLRLVVKSLSENSLDLDVSTTAIALNGVLERAKPGHEAVREDPLDR